MSIEAGPARPIQRGSGAVQAGPAIPVHVEQESSASTLIEGGPALPYYPVTDEEVASGAFRVEAGPARRVVLATQGSRRSVAGPAIPMRLVSASDAATLAQFTGARKDLVRSVATSTLEFYFPLSELTGTVARDLSGRGRNGVYSGPTLNSYTTPFACPAPLFDALTDYVDVYSAALAAALATWSEGTAIAFMHVSGAGVWTDGVARSILQISDSSQSNRINLWKYSVNNQVRVQRVVGGSSVQVIATVTPTTDVIGIGLSWSVTNNRLRAWAAYRGIAPAQIGTTQTGVTAWSSVTHSPNRCLIGNSYVTTPANLIDGSVFEVAGWSSELTPAQLAQVMKF